MNELRGALWKGEELSFSTITIAALLATTIAIPGPEADVVPTSGAIEKASNAAPTTLLAQEQVPQTHVIMASLQEPEEQALDPGGPANDKAVADEPVDLADKKESDRKDIVVKGELGETPGDPLESVNVQTFEVVQAVDKALVEPVARGYMKISPKPVRDGIHNVVTNLDEPIVFLSFLLQLKPLKALKTLGRFAVNSTMGVGGLFDVAKRKPFNHPHQPNGIGQTLAYYGVKSGAFLYLPLIGSTTVRDLFGTLAAMPILPLTIGKPFNRAIYVFPKATISAIDERAQDDERLTRIHNESSNPYPVYRSYYLRKRQAEIDMLKGLRDNAEVPVFEEDVPDIDESQHIDKGAALDSGDNPPIAQAQLQVEDAVTLAE
ncbi:MAG: VacJ family lipoprotein [Novosphingobium sp.]|nr:VacJ family lipoprotein [Novosphingobium sp.]